MLCKCDQCFYLSQPFEYFRDVYYCHKRNLAITEKRIKKIRWCKLYVDDPHDFIIEFLKDESIKEIFEE